MNYQKELNEKQYEAVTTGFSNVRVIAGAGSGKTRVLTYRIAYLISELHVLPWKILAITFTNKVANEMKNRVIKMIPQCEKDLTIKTFHSFAAMFLRKEISLIGFLLSRKEKKSHCWYSWPSLKGGCDRAVQCGSADLRVCAGHAGKSIHFRKNTVNRGMVVMQI